MSIGALLTVAPGLWLMFAYGGDWLAGNGWMHTKLALVAALIGYHGWCQIQVKRFREHRNRNSAGYFRWMNEVPSILLIAIVVLAVVKPF
jgi:putative membrane protein